MDYEGVGVSGIRCNLSVGLCHSALEQRHRSDWTQPRWFLYVFDAGLCRDFRDSAAPRNNRNFSHCRCNPYNHRGNDVEPEDLTYA